MRWLILNSDYPEFLASLYHSHPGLERQSYRDQHQARVRSLFGTADFYSSNLRALGDEAHNLFFNNAALQRAWALEHGLSTANIPHAIEPRQQSTRATVRQNAMAFVRPVLRPLIRRFHPRRTWEHDVLEAQIAHYNPDIILNHHPAAIDSAFLYEHRGTARLVVAQIASVLPPLREFRAYDLVLSSLPHFVQRFRHGGQRAEYFRLGFEASVLRQIANPRETIPVSFVGSFSENHPARTPFLEALRRRVEFSVWGTGAETLPPRSVLAASHRGPAWGREMYAILQASKITINVHEEVAAGYANNMRLFEATGVGTLLLTEASPNLPEIFDPGREVVTYANVDECAELIHYYSSHEAERSRIARAGQRRTLAEHTYEQRMRELRAIVAARI